MNHLTRTPNTTSPLRNVLAFIATLALAALILMFSAILLMVILVMGVLAFAFLWWKTRHLRKQMRDFSPHDAATNGAVFEGEEFKGEVIEGEVIRVVDPATEEEAKGRAVVKPDSR